MTLVRHELRQSWKSLMIWTLSISFFLLTVIFVFPLMKESMGAIEGMYASMDDSLMNAELSEEEAHETLTWLFSEAKGDYSVIKDYISRCSDIAADGLDLEALAAEIAHSLGLNDYISSDSDE